MLTLYIIFSTICVALVLGCAFLFVVLSVEIRRDKKRRERESAEYEKRWKWMCEHGDELRKAEADRRTRDEWYQRWISSMHAQIYHLEQIREEAKRYDYMEWMLTLSDSIDATRKTVEGMEKMREAYANAEKEAKAENSRDQD